ncbi:MAG: thioesterase domain-containing protein, partial [Gammaproteobacteria bacterium]
DLGGHSLLAVKLLSHVQQEFGRRLPVNLLFAHSTVAEFAEILRGEIEHVTAPTIVELQGQGVKPPVFVLPGAIGSVHYLYPLALRLGRDQPVYALPTPGLDGLRTPDSVTQLAAHHIEAVRRIHPRGPYHLVGHSSGGRVAFEMVRQLEQDGEEVALLAILDTNAPDPKRIKQDIEKSPLFWLRELVVLFAELTGLDFGSICTLLEDQADAESAYAAVLQGFKQHEVVFAPDAPVEELKALVNVYRTTVELHQDYYVQTPITCPIHLFMASDRFAEQAFEDTREAWGWANYTDAGVTILKVPGTHMTMLAEPHVRSLAEALSACLEGLSGNLD